MKRRMALIILLLMTTVPTGVDRLDDFVRSQMKEQQVPGAVVVVHSTTIQRLPTMASAFMRTSSASRLLFSAGRSPSTTTSIAETRIFKRLRFRRRQSWHHSRPRIARQCIQCCWARGTRASGVALRRKDPVFLANRSLEPVPVRGAPPSP